MRPGCSPFVILDYNGESRFHPSSVSNLAEAVLASSNQRGQAVFSLVDADCPTVSEVGQYGAELMGHQRAEILLPGPPGGAVGDSPWAVATYREQLADDIDWLLRATAGRDWRVGAARWPAGFPDTIRGRIGGWSTAAGLSV